MVTKSYKKFTSDIQFTPDTYVIIGSGIGGLTTAVFLAKAGKKVAVLEQHYTPGGFTHAFKRKQGLSWDVGVHYVGNMDETTELRRIFNYLSADRLDWDAIGDPYDVAWIGGKKYEFVAGKEHFRKKFHAYFPEDTEAIDAYLALLDTSAKRNMLFFIQKAFPTFLAMTLGRVFRKLHSRFSKKSTYDVLREITDNESLIAALCAQCGNYGLSPKESSFAIHSIVVNHFMEGGYYPRGGANQIHKTIIRHLQQLNVTVYVKAKVEKIHIDHQRVQGLVVNGTTYACKHVISGVGVHTTFRHLIGQEKIKHRLQKLTAISASTAHLCLYIGLNKSAASLALPKYNVWWYDTQDIDTIATATVVGDETTPLSFAYISFASAKDSEWDREHPDMATIQLIVKANYQDFEAYKEAPWLNRGEAYTAMKNTFMKKGMDLLTKLYPQITPHIIHKEVSTPVSTRTFSGYAQGEMYGLTHTPLRFQENKLTPKTAIKGLYLTGQDITVVGVAGAMASGILTASTIIKWKMRQQFKEIMTAH